MESQVQDTMVYERRPSILKVFITKIPLIVIFVEILFLLFGSWNYASQTTRLNISQTTQLNISHTTRFNITVMILHNQTSLSMNSDRN